jgi:hypothetical protein
MTCSDSCRHPAPSQAHCGACHITFGGVGNFDRHRKSGACVRPERLGLRANAFNVWVSPPDEAAQARFRAM